MTNVKFSSRPFDGNLNTWVDSLFSELPVLFKNDFNNKERKALIPVNVKETENGFEMEVVAPGFDKSDFKINLDQTLLTVSAEKKKETTEEAGRNNNLREIRREYGFRSFKRSFTLDEKIDATRISASYINGVLTLNLPKKETVREAAKEIEIR